MSTTHLDNSSYAPGRLLSALAQQFSASSDHELARKLQISPRVLRQIRAGHVAISPSLLLLMAETAVMPVDKLSVLLAERRRKSRMQHCLKPGEQPSGT